MNNALHFRGGLACVALVAATIGLREVAVRRSLEDAMRRVGAATESDRKAAADLNHHLKAGRIAALPRPEQRSVPPRHEDPALIQHRIAQANAALKLDRFIKKMHWSNDQRERFLKLATENEETLRDIRSAGDAQGYYPSAPAITAMTAAEEQSFRARLDAALGAGTADALKDYEQGDSYVLGIAGLNAELAVSGSARPLTTDQADRLKQALIDQGIPAPTGTPALDPWAKQSPGRYDTAQAEKKFADMEAVLAATRQIRSADQMSVVENFIRGQELQIELESDSTAIWRSLRKQPAQGTE